MATKEEYAQAAAAVKAGKATDRQKQMNKNASKQVGSMGREALDAIKNPIKK